MAPTLKVHNTQTPSQQIVEDANKVYEVTDARGRVIFFRRLRLSDQRRVLKAISNDSANKQQLFGMYLMAASVVSIDGDVITFPANEIQADALVDRLGDDGYAALNKGAEEQLGVTTAADIQS